MSLIAAVQEIDEPIKVVASFDAHRLRIHFFSWQERIYKVERFNLLHESKSGGVRRYHFSVSAGGTDYQLQFNPHDLDWRLERLCTE